MTSEVLTGRAIEVFASRALDGHRSASLLAISYQFNEEEKLISLKAHFLSCPSENEMEAVSDVEAEVIAAFPAEYTISTEVELLYSGISPHLLRDGLCYRREASS